MHKSRLAGFIIDSRTSDLPGAAQFWSSALGMRETNTEEPPYARLDASARDLHIEVQLVDHESRLHLDIEATDLDAEATRLEALGAKRISFVHERWWVMEAPTGHRFCIVRAKTPDQGAGWTEWP
ncbi:MAG TPA: VOC family protein [Kofleriaceae bacterium]|jgi:hypothetical protein